MDDLDHEIVRGDLRKQLLLNEIGENLSEVKANFSFSGTIFSALGSIFSFGSKKTVGSENTLERIVKIATSVGGLIALIRSFGSSKRP